MTARFALNDVEVRDDDGPTILTLSTTIDGFPIDIEVKHYDELSVLKFFKKMGTDQALFSLASMLDEARAEADDYEEDED